MNGTLPSISQALEWAQRALRHNGIDNPRLDAEVLLAHCLEADRVSIYRDGAAPLEKNRLEHFRRCVARRNRREPVAYITGMKEFHSLNFRVSPDVLIPRPETETMIEEVVKESITMRGGRDPLAILEVGTGSGIITVSLAKEIDRLRVIATDCTESIVLLARSNARLHGVDHKISFLAGDLFKPLKTRDRPKGFDFILCNPPYLSDNEWNQAQPEIRDYEPARALRAGPDGLSFYPALVFEAGHLLRDEGYLMLEIGQGQAVTVAQYIDMTALFSQVAIVRDPSGVERLVKAQKR